MPHKDTEEYKAYQRKYQQEYRKKFPEKRRTLAAKSRERNRQLVRDFKSNGCERCGETHPATLDLHHPNGDGKGRRARDFVHGQKSEQRIRNELAKCIVLCANCHRIIHYGDDH